MPKAKPTPVIVHRIELQEKEREYLEAMVAGQTVKNIVLPVATVAGVGAASYLGYKSLKKAYDWGEDAVDELVTQYKAAEVVYERQPGPLGNFVRIGKWLFT